MARPRAATYEEQHAQILAAAAALFAQQGYAATTMNAVAAASGVSKATLYHYFSDKAGLLEHIARRHVARLEALVGDTLREAATPQQRLRLLIVRFMQAYADAQHEHRVLTEDVKFLDDEARKAVLGGQRRVVAAFADALAAAEPRVSTGLRKPLAMLLFGMMNWTFTWLRPAGPLTHESLATIVADLFLGGIGEVTASGPTKRDGFTRIPRAPGNARRPRRP